MPSVASVSKLRTKTYDRCFIGLSPCDQVPHGTEQLTSGSFGCRERMVSFRIIFEAAEVQVFDRKTRIQAASSAKRLLAVSRSLAIGSDLEITADAPAARASFSMN